MNLGFIGTGEITKAVVIGILKSKIKYKKINSHYQIYGLGLNGFKTNRKLEINAGNSGTLARLILGLLINSKK